MGPLLRKRLPAYLSPCLVVPVMCIAWGSWLQASGLSSWQFVADVSQGTCKGKEAHAGVIGLCCQSLNGSVACVHLDVT